MVEKKESEDIQAMYRLKHVNHRTELMRLLHEDLDKLGIGNKMAYLNKICSNRFKVSRITQLDNDSLMILRGILLERIEKQTE